MPDLKILNIHYLTSDWHLLGGWAFNWDSICLYFVFGFFSYYHIQYAKLHHFRHGMYSKVLKFSAYLALLTQLAYITYYAYSINIIAAILITLMSTVFVGFAGTFLARTISSSTINSMAFFAWPVLGYLMFYSLLG